MTIKNFLEEIKPLLNLHIKLKVLENNDRESVTRALVRIYVELAMPVHDNYLSHNKLTHSIKFFGKTISDLQTVASASSSGKKLLFALVPEKGSLISTRLANWLLDLLNQCLLFIKMWRDFLSFDQVNTSREFTELFLSKTLSLSIQTDFTEYVMTCCLQTNVLATYPFYVVAREI